MSTPVGGAHVRRARIAGILPALALTLLGLAAGARTTEAAVQVDVDYVAHEPRPEIDVWTNREEGGVFRQGEAMRIYFRPSEDAFVLIYNIDTEGYIHLVYPYGPEDAERVEGGRTYQVPARHDPYELVADGPTGIEYVVAIASPHPFRNLPWYLSGQASYDDARPYDDDYEEAGVIVGDPYVGMDRIIRRVVPPGREDEVGSAYTYFYIERRVEYPRYVCADCHSYRGWYDPYVDACSVVHIRIDATWGRYIPLRTHVIRPRYFYMVRSTAPDRYRRWKERWSSVDGRTTLRERFRVSNEDKFSSRRQAVQRRTPQEFRDIRRARPDRIWRGRDEVIRGRETRQREQGARERQDVRARDVRDRRDDGQRWEARGNERERREAQQQREQRLRQRIEQERERRNRDRAEVERRGESRERMDQRRERVREERPRPREERRDGMRERREERRDERRERQEAREERRPSQPRQPRQEERREPRQEERREPRQEERREQREEERRDRDRSDDEGRGRGGRDRGR